MEDLTIDGYSSDRAVRLFFNQSPDAGKIGKVIDKEVDYSSILRVRFMDDNVCIQMTNFKKENNCLFREFGKKQGLKIRVEIMELTGKLEEIKKVSVHVWEIESKHDIITIYGVVQGEGV